MEEFQLKEVNERERAIAGVGKKRGRGMETWIRGERRERGKGREIQKDRGGKKKREEKEKMEERE